MSIVAKRTVRIKMSCTIVLDDDREGIPWVRDPADVIFHGVKTLPGIVELKSGGTLDMALDRESARDLRRRDRVRRANMR